MLVSDGGGDGARLVVWELSLYYSSLIISCEYGVVGVRTLTPVDKCYALLYTGVFRSSSPRYGLSSRRK